MGNEFSNYEPSARCKQAWATYLQSPLSGHISKLSQMVDCPIVLPKDPRYNQLRTRPYNIDQQGYPLVIIRVKSVHDIMCCIEFIRKFGQGIKVCVAGGCHSSHVSYKLTILYPICHC